MFKVLPYLVSNVVEVRDHSAGLMALWNLSTVEPPLTDFSIADTSLYRTKCCGPDLICIMHNTLQLSEMRTPRYSVKWTDFVFC